MGYYLESKKKLKESVGEIFDPVETSMFGKEYKGDGEYAVVGPDPYRNRKWFALVTVKEGLIIKVK